MTYTKPNITNPINQFSDASMNPLCRSVNGSFAASVEIFLSIGLYIFSENYIQFWIKSVISIYIY